jgi:hypothetical protein
MKVLHTLFTWCTIYEHHDSQRVIPERQVGKQRGGLCKSASQNKESHVLKRDARAHSSCNLISQFSQTPPMEKHICLALAFEASIVISPNKADFHLLLTAFMPLLSIQDAQDVGKQQK